MISVLVLTKNEEKDIAGCLESVSWSDDVHVFDSFSDDKTIDIATSFNVNIVQRKFDNYSSQRNAALTQLNYKHNWILILDADERIPQALADEMYDAVSKADINTNGFRIRRRDFLKDTWLKHSQLSPYYVRLIKRNKARYHREINEVLEVDGNINQLTGYFDHYPFSKGYRHWLDKHNVYSSMEAKRWIEEQEGDFEFSFKKAMFGNDFSERRYHQKGLFYKLPARPIIKWFYMVLVKRAFLDGKAGMVNATLQAIYEYFIVIKTKEIVETKKLVKGE